MTPDTINGMFEALGAMLIWFNIVRLHEDKIVRGIHWVPPVFFVSWGYWNLYYYPHLEQWVSFVAGVFLVIANTIWVVQMIYYKRKETAK